MEPHYILEFCTALLRELSRKRLIASIAFAITCIIVLCVGLIWPLKYETSATLYIDQRNIIEPLLRGQAEVQKTNQAQEASEKIYTRKILEKVAREAGLLNENADSKEIASAIAQLGAGSIRKSSGIQISNSGKNYLSLSYKNSEPEISFNVITALINAFIRNIADAKRQESKQAFEFIQSQVNMYKSQLVDAEQQLDVFNAANKDGTEDVAAKRIAELRTDIEELNLTIDETASRKKSIEQQISSEREYLSVRTDSDVYRQRLTEAQTSLKNMLVHFTETHPDVVNLKLQIADYKQAITDIESQSSVGGAETNDQYALNPLFEELRSNLSETDIQYNASVHRRDTLKRLLEEEYQRADRLTSRRAELSGLNRDYSVTKDLYEDMLNRKEKARLSMTLDIEGQGTSYKVHEPPTFPIKPSGITSLHFALLAPFAALLAPIGIIAAYIFLDPRIRLPSELLLIENAEVLAISPPVKNIASVYALRQDSKISIAVFASTFAIYCWVTAKYIAGVL